MTEFNPSKPFDSDRTQAFNLPNADTTIPNLNLGANPGSASLTIVRGPMAGERFDLDEAEVTIGRDPACGIFLNDRTVSRQHAHLTLRDGQATVEDLGSLNGTWVDGAIVSSGVLHDGSSLQIGTFKMIFSFSR